MEGIVRDSVRLGTCSRFQDQLAFLNNGLKRSRFFGGLNGLIHLVDFPTLPPQANIGVICVHPPRFTLAQETTEGIDLFLPLKGQASAGQTLDTDDPPPL